MFTRTEKTYLALTLAFLAAGSGLQAWRRSTVVVGPVPDAATANLDSARAAGEAGARIGAGGIGTAGPAGVDSMPEAPIEGGTLARREIPLSPEPKAGDGKEPALAVPEPAPDPGTGKIDLNRADRAGLMRIKGIGEKTAEAILAHRRAHGPFRSVRDLLRIKGIGEKKLERLAPHILL